MKYVTRQDLERLLTLLQECSVEADINKMDSLRTATVSHYKRRITYEAIPIVEKIMAVLDEDWEVERLMDDDGRGIPKVYGNGEGVGSETGPDPDGTPGETTPGVGQGNAPVDGGVRNDGTTVPTSEADGSSGNLIVDTFPYGSLDN